MFQEPFFLHPPGSRPRDGIYINPMSAYIGEPAAKQKDTTATGAESFYLHSPHDLVYTRITRLFTDTENKHRHLERKEETLTVKVDVHVNNGVTERPSSGNCYAAKPEQTVREQTEHAYEQICPRQEPEPGGTTVQKRLSDNPSDGSRSRKTDRRFSRSSSASESSNLSSNEVPCFSSSASTPSLSRHSSNERIGKTAKIGTESSHEKKDCTGSQVESEKEVKPAGTGASFAKPPPPPPPPPPPDREDVVVLVVNSKQTTDATTRDGKKDDEANRDGKIENGPIATLATNKSDVSCGEHQQPEVAGSASPTADTEEIKAIQTAHLVNRHMVLPFIPPQFANADSNTLLKPSEYLKSICKTTSKSSSLSKARSVDNLDIQSRGDRRETIATADEEQTEEEVAVAEGDRGGDKDKETTSGPPPPPLSPLQRSRRNGEEPGTGNGSGTGNGTTELDQSNARNSQPLATISIQDLTSIQLRRTTAKMNATKTFNAPPPRSVSMTNVSEPFFVQKTDLIAELKKTKDIPGIKKMKVEMAQVEKTQEQNLMSEISKAFSVSNFVDQIPEKDSSGNLIPIWKRQMLARKAAERAKKELEEQIARENEERRQKAIPAWKRQLLAKKDHEEKRLNHAQTLPPAKVDVVPMSQKRDASPSATNRQEEPSEPEEKKNDATTSPPGNRVAQANDPEDEEDNAQIIPWRAQLRKTNSKLNILD
ncbi:hypothetical protein WN55_03078 [Dufourea novaeangliae]|uniref:Espin n=2 Tax=Dufourea novaeangliae TaxID=178035 RepID=A0A154PI50_DUFNO|nr:hypothetical protein WN55_03078 [Dufourea novaeangliae]